MLALAPGEVAVYVGRACVDLNPMRTNPRTPLILLAAGSLTGWLNGGAGAQPQTVLTVDEGDPDRPIAADVSTSISSTSTLSSLGDDLEAVIMRESAGGEAVAALMLEDGGDLTLRVRTDVGWGSNVAVATNVSAFDAAYERRSGDLLIAYGKSSSSLVFRRELSEGSLSGESSSSFGLGGSPARIVIAMDDSTDSGVIAAASAIDLACAVWDGDALGTSVEIDASYAGGAWDCAWPAGAGECMIAWVRTGDASPRFRLLSGGSWTVQALGSPMTGTIREMDLVADEGGKTPALLGAFLTGPSADGLEAAAWDGSSWSLSSTLSTDVGGVTAPFAIAFEGSGGGAVAAWIEDGSQRITTSRWNGSAWSISGDTAVIGTLDRVVAAAQRNDTGVVLGAIVREVGAGEPYSEYIALSSEGNVELDGVTVNGDTREGGVSLPPAPSVSSGSPDLSYGNNKTVSLAPGTRGKLSVGNNFTLNMTAGDYVFEEFDSDKNGTTLVGDTSGGDIRFIISNGNFKAKNNFTVTTIGPGVIEFIVVNGNWEVKNNTTIEAMVVVHNGNLSFGNGADITGHLYAKGNIEGGSGTLTVPGSWIPGGGGPETREAHALIVSSGAPGSISTLSTGWTAGELPLAISHPVSAGSPTILRWSEVEPQ